MLETRSVVDGKSLCPAAASVGETSCGSGVLCRITGNLVTTAENPSSLAAFCWAPKPHTLYFHDGEAVEHGYQACPVWRYNREQELAHKQDDVFVTKAST